MTQGAVELRSYVFLDSLQRQLAAFVATTARGYLPVGGQAALYVEIAPGIAINRLMDVALKQNDVQPAVQVVERAYGLLEIHSDSQAEVTEAGARILASLDLTVQDRLRPRVLTSERITRIEAHQATLVNRNRGGSMLLEGDTLYVLEVHPAGYATLAANEAEKTSPITLVDLRPYGAFGRLYLAGTEAVIDEGRRAIHAALEGVDGRPNEAGERHS